ncbi:hypothetical protein NL676_034967 [Syzygium grande]|nr:hypothetical protein NL676_034967 [Syzygium grande]
MLNAHTNETWGLDKRIIDDEGEANEHEEYRDLPIWLEEKLCAQKLSGSRQPTNHLKSEMKAEMASSLLRKKAPQDHLHGAEAQLKTCEIDELKKVVKEKECSRGKEQEC